MTDDARPQVLHVFGRMARGGAETRTVELMPELAQRGVRFDYCVMLGGEGALNQRIADAGSTVEVCEIAGPLPGFVRRFRKVLKRRKPDIVHSHLHLTSGLILTIARFSGVKQRIAHFRNSSDGQRASLPRRAYQGLMRWLIRRNATAILAVSHGAMEGGLGPSWQRDKRARVIYNGIDTAGFPPHRPATRELRRELGVEDDAVLVAQVGRFAPAKAHDITVDAVRRVVAQDKRYVFLFIGEGDLRDPTYKLAQEAGVLEHIRFMGLRADVPDILTQVDLSLLPSHWEGLPGVVLESLAAGTRVIASDLPGVREIAALGDGVTVLPETSGETLAAAILAAGPHDPAADPQPALPDAFHLGTCADQFYAVYAELLGLPAPAIGATPG